MPAAQIYHQGAAPYQGGMMMSGAPTGFSPAPVNPKIAAMGQVPVVQSLNHLNAMPPPPEAAREAVSHDLKAGDFVKLAGLAMNPEYEDKVFLVEVPNVGDGRVQVKFQHHDKMKKLFLDPSALERYDPAPYEIPPALVGGCGGLVGGGGGVLAQPRPAAPQQLSGRVRIVGLPNHNGKAGFVLPPGIPDVHGHVKVQLEGGMGGGATVLDLPLSYLEPLEAFGQPRPDVAATMAQFQTPNATGFNPGDRVQIKGLSARPEYNGKPAVVESISGDEVLVKFEHPGMAAVAVHLKPGYLERL